MADLSHWDAVTDFTAEQAAALAVGLDPDDPAYSPTKGRHTYERMKDCYSDKKMWLAEDDDDGVPKDEFALTESPSMLKSCDMDHWLRGWSYDNGNGLERWLQDENKSGFESQRFSRQELARWLSAIGMKSVYVFDTAPPQATTHNPSGIWPWGSYSTKLLEDLDAAAREFWVKYDPADVKTTAPKNETVVKWLHKERGVSGSMAQAMATILRATGLRTGPRK